MDATSEIMNELNNEEDRNLTETCTNHDQDDDLKIKNVGESRKRKFPCDLCEYAATRLAHLKSHKKSKHNVPYEIDDVEQKAKIQKRKGGGDFLNFR